MKTLWKLISVIAVVNLLAVVSTAGWLVATGRIDRERWQDLRTLLAQPAAPATQPEAAPAEDAVGDVVPTSARIDAKQRAERQHSMSLRRLQDEKELLDKALEDRRQKLDTDERSFEAERADWEATTSAARDAKAEEQFKKTVKLLESVPPKQAKEMLLELVREQKVDDAVGYLDAMSPFKASGVLKAFKGEEENKVATDLLERLRRRADRARTAQPATPPAAGSPLPAETSEPNGSNAQDAQSPADPASKPVANSGAAVEGAGGGKPSQPQQAPAK